ncbi:lipopolysaccharide heptosyltransferase I [Orrella sp. 11846]|uniref:lipopolysaccharide heptosyltransferase I n=1 Tax=Orrella sp. 11846 TaxID=3409913 RepID=UPI003B5B7077
MRILIVRTSSLGDLIHMLPAMTDIAKHHSGVTIDWVVEESFAEIPGWHPAIQTVIPVAHRRWRRNWWSSQVRKERQAVLAQIRANRYDLVLDMQALLKSIGLVRAASGVHHGLDWRSAREPLCTLFYDVRHRVEFWQPAVIRQRKLAALALGHSVTGAPDFGLGERFIAQPTSEPYAVIMPSASRDDKLWPEQHWQVVFDVLQRQGLSLVLLAGSETEAQRAQALLGSRAQAWVQPKSSLTELAQLMVSARVMIGLDSGLTHLSAALGVDTIGLYKASTPVRTPVVGSGQTFSLGDRGREATLEEVLAAMRSLGFETDSEKE